MNVYVYSAHKCVFVLSVAHVSAAWTACGSASQAFGYTSAFNANIGAWNTASVSNMAYVCAAPAARKRRRPARSV